MSEALFCILVYILMYYIIIIFKCAMIQCAMDAYIGQFGQIVEIIICKILG